ncbi:porin [Bradyrhizobium sp. ISRA443]|uniref:porin n=1 Tax=unclassified Bradyrhizobium TaxID=2631580 RepID=UPI00247995E0|nr:MULTISPECIES: porin [unclassified Bradyrhizobium]WGR93447.1 porin [Bradyrhizobium sp. ISRA435]WGR97994.1 porin [Bradyrhizobium sp. ISRA436]WGS04884.1 porin [Bradyrhizobium sp. ISRA437]WGS11766.1 porin [Bradyrhizobium sp. ISRA443]
MKVAKSLLLGSAAGLIALGGARAADLPIKAKAVEYVRICSLYGARFYYVPGTDTCIKLGGYLRGWLEVNNTGTSTNPDFGAAGAANRFSNSYTWRSRQHLSLDTRTATEYGMVRTYFEGVFQWTSGKYSGLGNGSTAYAGDTAAGGTFGLWYAFIQFAGFTIGKAGSQFSTPWGEYPANFAELPGSGSWDPVNQFTYTADFGQGITASFSVQDQVVHDTSNIWNVSAATAAGFATGAYGGNDIAGTIAPDLIAMARVDQAWGLFQASVAAHDNHAAYYGATELSGHPDDKWGWASQLALSIKNIPTGPGDSINMSGVYANGASRYTFNDYMATTYARYGGANLAGTYQSVGLAGLSDSLFVAGAGQQLTTTFGFNGGFNHNWDPHWVSSIFGGIGAVRYNNTAKGYICNALVSGLALSSGTVGCNPDFNYAVVGTRTNWTPVMNLTFTAELAYSMLDQKYASGSTVVLPLQSGIGKPTAVYELKDQSSLVVRLMAQRNF